MKQKLNFERLEEARRDAGFFISEACEILGISEQTWRRWRRNRAAPVWAVRHLELLNGDLTHLGWRNWVIKNGVLYEKSLNPRYHFWEPADLLMPLFYIPRGQRPKLFVIQGRLASEDTLTSTERQQTLKKSRSAGGRRS